MPFSPNDTRNGRADRFPQDPNLHLGAYSYGGFNSMPHFIIQSVPDGIKTMDGQMRITDLDRAAEQLTGCSREEALGQSCGEILQSILCGKECH